MAFWNKSEIDKVKEKYGETKGRQFLTYFYTFTKKTVALMQSNKNGADEIVANVIANILERHGQAYLNEYNTFFKANLQNAKLLSELAKSGSTYIDDSITVRKQVAATPAPSKPVQKAPASKPTTAKPIDALGRDESKHISCKYDGHEDDCPDDCAKCAISIKTDGDIALASNRPDKAIQQYKKAVFVSPKFAEAWVNLGNAYGMKSEYNNALSAFNKAIAIDPTYGKALFGKAITLKNLGKLDEAMALANRILEMYDDPNVKTFKETLVRSGVKDMSSIYSLEQTIEIMTDKAYDIIQANNMLDENGRVSTEKEIYFKEDFARSIYDYCKKQYGVLGLDKVWSESILAAFYGSLCTTLLYYNDKAGFKEVAPFAYLSNHVNLEELDRIAERLLEIRQDERKSDDLWNLIYSYVTACKSIFEKVEPKEAVEAAVIDATESAYVMGMLFAMRHNESKKINDQAYLAGDSKNNTSNMGQISSAPSLPAFSSKKLSDYKALEQIEVTGESSSDASRIDSEKIAETDDYYIYSCSREGEYSRHIIRQSKNNPSDIVYISYEYESLCYFNGQLFYKTHEHWGGNELYSIDIASGQHMNYKWFSKKGYAIIDVVVGQDLINSVRVENGKLIIDVSRTKSNFPLGENNKDDGDPFDLTMNYTLCVGLDNGKYYLSRFYKDIDVSRLQIIYHAPRKKWHVATAQKMYYLIDNNKKVAKTSNGNVLETSYLDLAKRMADDLEQHGGNALEMTLLSLQMNMRDNVVQFTHKEMEENVASYFKNLSDWTYYLRGNDPEWNKLFGNKISRNSEIDCWLRKTTHMQMNAALLLGKKYKSLNLAFIFALLVEKVPVAEQTQSFVKLANYIRNHSSYSIEKNDFEVFASYYGIHFASDGSAINDETIDVDVKVVFSF